MRLEDALCREPASILQSYQYLERQVNDGSPSGEHRTVSKLYSPIEGTKHFPLPYVLVPTEKCEVIGNNPSLTAKRTIGLNGQQSDLRFFLHPDMADTLKLGKTDTDFQVFPTSSGRTVCRVDSENPVYIKLHYDGILGRIVRKMGREKVAESVYSSEDLDRLREKGICNSSFDFFPESLGLISKMGKEGFGFVVRDFNTRNQPDGIIVPRIPWFSLFSLDRQKPNDPPLLKQWVESKVGRNLEKARDYVFKNFIKPVVDCYTFLSTEVGVVSDYNAQNLLIIPDENGDVDRIAFRDLHSFYLDADTRRKNGLPVDCARKIDTQSEDGEDTRYAFALRSVYFDHKFSDLTRPL
ncbi:MAG: siderophore synthetase component-like protein [uncultured bacterium]|nr:MAG: siderophore synthetase component-like protein [uncultured bacterium]